MQPQKIYLKDYQPPTHDVLNVDLLFEIETDFCRVTQTSRFRARSGKNSPLFLDGEELKLDSLYLNQELLLPASFRLEDNGIHFVELPSEFELKIITILEPAKNTALEGLYQAQNATVLCTQCEAQGFRRITYFMDRPDVMSLYRVRIIADKKRYPILLANGDLIKKEDLANGKHQVEWHDPYKKPCYLFALVAGNLGVLRDQFTTASGRHVALEIYSPEGSQDRCHHAMASLKKSMTWDEERFGREYDLNTYMILAVDDFNAGAMENKGLNIFNSRLVFADSKTATDLDYYNIESVVAHEYFHNWTGNRVTLRDWFHLSLKEGLTVFRDQEFSMDMSSREMVRIENVADLRASQFAEDAGPNAHPIRPEFCFAVDNFFTGTIYEKGSEVIRMMQTMVGRPGFRKGMDLYFNRHDGQAVIIEDFAKAIADANQQEWHQFKLWYSQAGTPRLRVQDHYDHDKQTYTLTIEQVLGPSPGQEQKQAYHIPLAMGLLGAQGQELDFSHPALRLNSEKQKILHVTEMKADFLFKNITERPVASLNRQFSAPLHLEQELSSADQLFLLRHDNDSFNRWEAGQKIALQEFTTLLRHNEHQLSSAFLNALNEILLDESLPADFRSALISLPEDSYILQLVKVFESQNFKQAREGFDSQIGTALRAALYSAYQRYHGKNLFSKDSKDFGRRRLKNKALAYLAYEAAGLELCTKQFLSAEIMTDEQAAFAILLDQESGLRKMAIERFHDRWKDENLVMNKWFQAQALSSSDETFTTVVSLLDHPAFNIKNPNRVYALLLRFGENLVQFHNPAYPTYSFLVDQIILLDRLNPQVATRVAGSFDVWRKLPEIQKKIAHSELERLIRSGLSSNTYEIVSKQLAN